MAKSDWTELLADLLRLILDRLSIFEYACCRLVCTSWRRALAGPPRPQAPYLLLPDAHPNFRNILCLTNRSVYRLRLPIIAGARNFHGSSDGWLAAVDTSGNLHLVNPLTSAHLPLPPTSTLSAVRHARPLPGGGVLVLRGCYRFPSEPRAFADSYYKKVVALSLSPSSTITFAIHGPLSSLAVATPGDESWIEIPCTGCPTCPARILDHAYVNHKYCRHFHDIVRHKGQLCAVNALGNVVAFDVSVWPPKAADLSRADKKSLDAFAGCYTAYYLVETADGADLLQLRQVLMPDDSKKLVTVQFHVFELASESGTWKWVEVRRVRKETAFFVGQNRSVSVSTVDVPELKENCIYFTSAFSSNCCDMGVYSLDDEKIGPFVPRDEAPWYDQLHGLHSIWFTPSLS